MNQKADLPPPSAAGEANQNTSSSSSSSSSLSPPAFIKSINAVFKRHRPLGTMHSRASRVLVSQADPPAASGPIAGNNVSKRSYLAGASIGAARVPTVDLDLRKNPPDGSSITPAPVTGAVNTRHGGDAAMVADLDCVTFQSYNARMTETRVGDISSHFHSLALTEGEGHRNDDAVMNPNQGHPQSMIVYGHGGSSAAASLLERREELRHDQQSMDPATRSSVMGTTCVTTMSLHSGPSAPAGQTAFATQMSRQDDTVPEGQGAAPREGGGLRDHKQVPQLGTSIKENDVSSNFSHLQSQAPLTTNIPSQNEPSHSSKAEKAPRKKKYDPDVFFKVNGKLYQRLGKIGSGGSSEVHKVITSDCTIYALKKINLKGRDYPTAYGFCQEIEYLNRMKGKNNIIQLIDYEVTDKTLLQGVTDGSMVSTREGRIKDDQYIYMVLEYGEIDLAHMLSHKWKGMDNSSWKIDENWLRFYWQQMLEAVNKIHNERIVHSDLKPANFLLVRGSLKLIDFGIAKAILSDTTNIQRDAQVGTLNYMSPEAFMWNEQDANGNTIKCGRPSDIWSLGCILYQMVYGKTPFAEYNTFWAKFKVITDRNHEIAYEPVSNLWLVDLMQKCLAWDRNERWRIPQLLQHPFLAPPVPRGVPGSSLVEGDHPCRILMEQVGVYWDDPEVSRLCSELQEVVANLEKEKKDSAL